MIYNILICDDDIVTAELIKERINWSELNMQAVGLANNGLQGLEIFKQCKVDIVLADIKMPIMSGLEMAKKICQNDKKVKIVFFTASDDVKDAITAIDLKAAGYILKPFTISSIVNVLYKLKKELESQTPELVEEDVDDDASDIVSLVDQYIQNHVFDKIKMNDIAESLGYSRNYLGQIYKLHTGMYINDKIVSEKMQMSTELLDIRINTIENISYKLGYTNYSYFVKQFKDYYGVTPTMYRRMKK